MPVLNPHGIALTGTSLPQSYGLDSCLRFHPIDPWSSTQRRSSTLFANPEMVQQLKYCRRTYIGHSAPLFRGRRHLTAIYV